MTDYLGNEKQTNGSELINSCCWWLNCHQVGLPHNWGPAADSRTLHLDISFPYRPLNCQLRTTISPQTKEQRNTKYIHIHTNYLSHSITLWSHWIKGNAFEELMLLIKWIFLLNPTSNNKTWIHIENVPPFYQKIYCAE
jgi:hypothetical protein